MNIDLMPALTTTICRIKRLRLTGAAHIPPKGPALIAARHSSPLDFFYYRALMGETGRSDHTFVTAADVVDAERFRPYTAASLAQGAPWLGPLAGGLARVATWIVPPFMQRFHPILVQRQGDDSAARDECVAWLLAGHLLTIAPEWGDNRHRDANGDRPLTYSIPAIARRFFETAHEALPILPVDIGVTGRGLRAHTYLRVGPLWRPMDDRQYPALFSPAAQADVTIKHQAYADFNRQLVARLLQLK